MLRVQVCAAPYGWVFRPQILLTRVPFLDKFSFKMGGFSRNKHNNVYTFFYETLGSGRRSKSFLISHEILSILVLKVS